MENIKVIQRIRIKRREKQLLLRIVTGFLIFSILLNVGIAALYPQIVYASFAGTVAGYILTLFASFNCAITNPNVVGAINNTFGSMALEAADAGVIQQGLTQIAQTTGFDMTTIFSNTAAEAAQFAQVAGVEIESVASTAGENIAAGAAACAATAGSVLPAIAGTVLPAAGAVALGIGGGIIIDHIRQAVGKLVYNSSPINVNPQNFPDGVLRRCYNQSNNGTVYYIETSDPNVIIGHGTLGNSSDNYFAAYRSQAINQNTRIYIRRQNGTSSGSVYIYANENLGYAQRDSGTMTGGYDFGDLSNFDGRNIGYFSPDIVGQEGNQIANYDPNTQNYNMPNIGPIYNYGDTVIQYINPTDYQTLVDDANNNTNNRDTGEDTQGETFKDFVNPYIKPVEDTPINPDNPNDELPYPQPTIAPTDPTIPVQPTPAPEPTLTPEEETEMPKGMVQPSLKDKFPFCIPFDIAYLFAVMSDEREAPQFVWTLDFGQWGQYEIEVDLSMFDSVAAIFRLCELILFILGLMLITKSLMSSNDGG